MKRLCTSRNTKKVVADAEKMDITINSAYVTMREKYSLRLYKNSVTKEPKDTNMGISTRDVLTALLARQLNEGETNIRYYNQTTSF